MILDPIVRLMPGETPTSYATRLACINGIFSTTTFCTDLGINLSGLFDGKPDALARLAELVALPVERLARDAWRLDDGGAATYRLRGEVITRAGLRREGRRICAACIRDDIRTSPLPHGAAAWHRCSWKVVHLRTCPVHRLAMTELPPATHSASQRDLFKFFTPHVDRIDEFVDASISRAPSTLEAYLIARLEGRTATGGLLDALPFYAAAKTCEMLGIASLAAGRAPNLRRLDSEEWHRAGQRGFEIVAGGPDEVQRYLTLLRASRTGERRGWKTASAYYGLLHHWLAHECNDSAYDPLREAIELNLVENVPFTPGYEPFGRPLVGRKVHSVWSATMETGVHTARLRKVLAFTGHISSDHSRHRANDVLFDAVAAKDLIRRLGSSLTFRELVQYLGPDRVLTQILIKAGHIQPVVEGPESIVGYTLYAREDVDAFLGAIRRGGHAVTDVPAGAYPIKVAAKKASTTALRVIGLILDRKLDWIGCLEGAHAFHGVLVDLEEVRRLVRGPELAGYPPREAGRRMKVSERSIYELIERGLIGTVSQEHPTGHRRVRVVPFAELARFRETYVSLFEASRDLDLHHLVLRRRLTAASVLPVCDPHACGVTLYLREQVEALRD